MNGQNSRSTVLLVEDEPLLRQVFMEALEDGGFEVEEADCGDTAWSLVERGLMFDILLTDVRMPGRLDGVDLARKVKASSRKASIVVMSGFVGPAAMDSELGTFLRKPFTSHRLVEAIKEIAAHR